MTAAKIDKYYAILGPDQAWGIARTFSSGRWPEVLRAGRWVEVPDIERRLLNGDMNLEEITVAEAGVLAKRLGGEL